MNNHKYRNTWTNMSNEELKKMGMFDMLPKFENSHLKKLREYAKSKSWELDSNAFFLDRGVLTIRRFDIGVYKKKYNQYLSESESNRDLYIKYKLDTFLIDKIRELFPELKNQEIKINVVDKIGNDSFLKSFSQYMI